MFFSEFFRDWLRFNFQRVHALFRRIIWIASTLLSKKTYAHFLARKNFEKNKLEHAPKWVSYIPVKNVDRCKTLTPVIKNSLKPLMYGRPKIWPTPTRFSPQKQISIYYSDNILANKKGQVFDVFGRTINILWHSPPLFVHKWLQCCFHGIETGIQEERIDIVEFDEIIIIQQQTNKTYGHFLIEVLPRMIIVRENCEKKLPIYFTVDHEIYAEMLTILGIESDRFVSAEQFPMIKVKKAIIPKYTKRRGWICDPIYLQQAVDEIITFVENEKKVIHFPKRIFIKRSTKKEANINRDSMLVNADELEAVLKKRGFATIYPEQLSMSEQVQIFNNADVVIGEHGSGLFNAVFCNKKAIVFDLHAARPIETLFDVLSMLEIKYIPVMTPEGSMVRWKKQKFTCSIESVLTALNGHNIN